MPFLRAAEINNNFAQVEGYKTQNKSINSAGIGHNNILNSNSNPNTPSILRTVLPIYDMYQESAELVSTLQENRRLLWDFLNAQNRLNAARKFFMPTFPEKHQVLQVGKLSNDICEQRLDTFWNGGRQYKGANANQSIGFLYEQYIGYLYEKEGWQVEYYGIVNGKNDLGRDLICKKDKVILIVQCKKWGQGNPVHENAICQLYGTVYVYTKESNSNNFIYGVLYTTTSLSDEAKNFAEVCGITTFNNFKLERFHSVKCKCANNGKKLFYLPFDKEYFNIVLDVNKGDTYTYTVAEAESKGFIWAHQ